MKFLDYIGSCFENFGEKGEAKKLLNYLKENYLNLVVNDKLPPLASSFATRGGNRDVYEGAIIRGDKKAARKALVREIDRVCNVIFPQNYSDIGTV